MNRAQRKILVIACFIFSPVFLVAGLVLENTLIFLIFPIASIFAGFYLMNQSDNDLKNKHVTYEEYANVILPITVNAIAIGFVDALVADYKKQGLDLPLAANELKQFFVERFDIEKIKFNFIELMRKSYTYDEFQFLANHSLSPLGLKIYEKSQLLYKDAESVLMPEISRVAELANDKFQLFD